MVLGGQTDIRKEMSILERCPYWRGVHIGEVSILERCPYWRDVHIREVSIFERCPY
jgi:hypothetical protein